MSLDISYLNGKILAVTDLGGLVLPQWDFASLTEASTTDTWEYKNGGSSGTIIALLVITYTDSTKNTISTIELTT